MFKMIKNYTKGYRLPTVLTPIFIVFEVILDVAVPTMMAFIVDVAGKVATGRYVYEVAGNEFWDGLLQKYPVFAEGTALLWTLGGICVFLVLAALLFGALAGRTVAVAGSGFAANLRKALYDKIQTYSFANVDKFTTAGLVTRITTDVNNAQQCFMQLLRIVIRAPLMLITATIFAYRMSSDVGWIFFVVVPVMGVFMAVVSYKTYPRFKKMLKMYDDMNATVEENLVAVRVVKAYVREDYEMAKYDKSAEGVKFARLAAEKIILVVSPVATAMIYATTIAILSIGGQKMIGGTMDSGALTSLVSYAMQILMSVMMVTMVIIQLVLSRASILRINEAMDEVPSVSDGASDDLLADGSVIFRHADFSYSGNKENLTLSDVDFEIKSGETVGIIGGTGEGKSSLVQLIPRFYDVIGGQVLVGGKDVRDYKLKNLRDGVSMVLQKNVLFSGTIEENLRWGNENATMDEIVTAAKVAQAHDFVCSFPKGYDTDLGQGGVNVSGGQKQRLCIARALLKKPKILILDDSTSAVDTATDAKIRDGLKRLDEDMTVIIIAQRVGSIENCDKIVVLSEGKVDAVGTHEQLLASNKIYREVYFSQQKGADENA